MTLDASPPWFEWEVQQQTNSSVLRAVARGWLLHDVPGAVRYTPGTCVLLHDNELGLFYAQPELAARIAQAASPGAAWNKLRGSSEPCRPRKATERTLQIWS